MIHTTIEVAISHLHGIPPLPRAARPRSNDKGSMCSSIHPSMPSPCGTCMLLPEAKDTRKLVFVVAKLPKNGGPCHGLLRTGAQLVFRLKVGKKT